MGGRRSWVVTGCGYSQVVDSDRSWVGRRSWVVTGRGYSQVVDSDRSWVVAGRGWFSEIYLSK